ncbi:MAG TPA: hypothetical protein VIW67_11195 [Terriglobales bacterium]|jgi:hypothetical protein
MKKLLLLSSAVVFLLLATLPAFADGVPIPPLPPQKGHVVQVMVVQ